MPAERLRLPDQIREAILNHSEACLPNECCGLLASDETGEIVFAYPLTNVEPSPVSYTIAPEEHFHSLNHAESRRWDLSGVFHSHPGGPAFPSATDVAKALEPDWLYLIVAGDEIRGFRIRDARIAEVDLA